MAQPPKNDKGTINQNRVILILVDEFAPEYAQPKRSVGHIAHIRAPARPVGGALHFVRAVIPPRASADREIN